MNRVEKNGKVAVLVSVGFGAGWSSWASFDDPPKEFLLMDPGLVELAEKNASTATATAYMKGKYPDQDMYMGGWEDVVVVWVPKGERFRITEYDGSEQLEILSQLEGVVA